MPSRANTASCVLLATLTAAGCGSSHAADPDGGAEGGSSGDGAAGDVGAPDAAPSPEPTSRLDLLLMVDDSAAAANAQVALAEQLPTWVDRLLRGDPDGDGMQEARAVRSLQVGMVSADMGAGGFDVPTCEGEPLGDDGELVTDGNLSVAGCSETYPAVHRLEPPADMEAVRSFTEGLVCVARLGRDGCGFEQSLESVLKALTPSTSELRFARDTTGHGDGVNAGLLRDDSVLAVVVLTDEDDCSAADPDLYNPDSTRYGSDLGVRCIAHSEALHPVGRYVEGLLALRDHPARLVFTPLTGVPRDLLGSADMPPYDEILADERMQPRIDPDFPRPEASCSDAIDGQAHPPHRVVRTAAELDRRGAHTTVASLCDTDLEDPGLSRATPRVLQAIGEALGPPGR